MVSVIIVVYNGEKYIKQAIESVLNQTYKNIELIVADDGSIDNTAEIVKKYSGVKYVYQKNNGEGSARNLGMSVASGEYFAFLDADDLYKEDKIEKQVRILKDDLSIAVVYNDLEVVDENLNYLNTLKSEGKYPKREDLLAMILFRQVVQGPICMMIRKKCADEIKWNEKLIYTVDYEYTIKLAQKYNFKYIEEPLYVYRRHGNNLSNSHNATLQEEIQILKTVGIEKIKDIVYSSNFDLYNKELLIARIYMKMLEYEKGKEILLRLLTQSKDEILYFNLANCCYHTMDLKNAEIFYKNAIEIDETMAEAHNNLGCILSKNDKVIGKECFKKALSLRESYMDAEVNIKNILGNKNEFKLTERELRKVLTLYKHNP